MNLYRSLEIACAKSSCNDEKEPQMLLLSTSEIPRMDWLVPHQLPTQLVDISAWSPQIAATQINFSITKPRRSLNWAWTRSSKHINTLFVNYTINVLMLYEHWIYWNMYESTRMWPVRSWARPISSIESCWLEDNVLCRTSAQTTRAPKRGAFKRPFNMTNTPNTLTISSLLSFCEIY